MSSTDDSSTSRPLSEHSDIRDADDASWDLLNAEQEDPVDQSFATIREESEPAKTQDPPHLPPQAEEETKTEAWKLGDMPFWQMAGSVILVYFAYYAISNTVSFLYWMGRIHIMYGSPDDIPASEIYFDLHHRICSITLANAEKKLQSCIAVAEQFENKLYFKACYKEYEKVINDHHEFCNWHKATLVKNTFLPEFSRLLEIGGEGLTGMVEFLNEHHINFEGAQNVGYQIIDGTVYVLQHSKDGLSQFSEYLNKMGFNSEQAKKTSVYAFENTIKGSQIVIEAGANAVNQGVQFVQNAFDRLF